MKKARQKINDGIINLLSQPFHIVGVYQGKEKAKRYDEFNNIFFDIVSFYKAMIQFYKLSHEESFGIVKFVIKLDETKIVKCKKLERVSITLMNRALYSLDNGTLLEKFSVQSKSHNWWVGAFEVDSKDFLVQYEM